MASLLYESVFFRFETLEFDLVLPDCGMIQQDCFVSQTKAAFGMICLVKLGVGEVKLCQETLSTIVVQDALVALLSFRALLTLFETHLVYGHQKRI